MRITSDDFALVQMDLDFSSHSTLMANSAFSEY